MQKLLTFQEAPEVLDKIEVEAAKKGMLNDHLFSNKTASFEWGPHFSLCSFDWYHVNSPDKNTHSLLIYLDREDLFVFCDSRETRDYLAQFTDKEKKDNDQMLRRFLSAMLAHDMDYIDDFEDDITEAEDKVLAGHHQGNLEKILEYRKELLRLKRYYTQLQVICAIPIFYFKKKKWF